MPRSENGRERVRQVVPHTVSPFKDALGARADLDPGGLALAAFHLQVDLQAESSNKE